MILCIISDFSSYMRVDVTYLTTSGIVSATAADSMAKNISAKNIPRYGL